MIDSAANTERIINALADQILDDDSALSLDDIDELADLLTERAFRRLCAAIDCCPFHHCDIDTCLDDDLDCADRQHQFMMTF